MHTKSAGHTLRSRGEVFEFIGGTGLELVLGEPSSRVSGRQQLSQRSPVTGEFPMDILDIAFVARAES